MEDLLRLVSQEALSSSLEDTSFSWMSDHLPSAIAGAIQKENSSHALIRSCITCSQIDGQTFRFVSCG